MNKENTKKSNLKNYCSRHAINDILAKYIKNSTNQEVNILKNILQKDKKKSLSIIGEYVGLDFQHNFGVINDNYHGLSPLVDANLISGAIKADVFRSIDSLNIFMDNNCGLSMDTPAFSLRHVVHSMIEHTKEDITRSLFAKSLICMAKHFGYTIDITNCIHEVSDVLKLSALIFDLDYKISDATRYTDFSPEPSYTLNILGCSVFNVLSVLSNKFRLIDNKLFTLSSPADIETNDINLSLLELKLLGKCYYSGVFPKVLEIHKSTDTTGNPNLQIYAIKFCKTTYSTLDAMDQSYANRHPLLNEHISRNAPTYAEILDSLDDYEDMLKKKYIDIPNCNLEEINKCLSLSYNTNSCAVSCDVETDDSYHIITRRSTSVVDSGYIYPSSNGQSEICDKNVSFYNLSVYEDNPTICVGNTNKRIDFNDEIRRESFAELGIDLPKNRLEYLGISLLASMKPAEISGINQQLDDLTEKARHIQELILGLKTPLKKRRMHLNIYAKSVTNDGLEEVEKKALYAVENFESDMILGIKICIDNTKKDRVFRYNELLIHFTTYLESFTILLLSIAILLASGISLVDSGDFSSVLDIIAASISGIIALLSLVSIVHKFNIYVRRRKNYTTWKHSFIKGNTSNDKTNSSSTDSIAGQCSISVDSMNKFVNKLDKFVAGKKSQFHPVALLMLMYIFIDSED